MNCFGCHLSPIQVSDSHYIVNTSVEVADFRDRPTDMSTSIPTNKVLSIYNVPGFLKIIDDGKFSNFG